MRTKTPRRPRTSESPISIRLERSLLEAIRRYAHRTGRPVSSVIKEMLEIALRTQTYPGIIFFQGPAGRRAHLAGTGLDVWEVVKLLGEHKSPARLQEHFPRLSQRTIQIAEAYARAYPDEINRFLELSVRLPEQLREELPWVEVVH